MTRKFKTAGVLVAVVAVLALTASSAQATFTSAGGGSADFSGTSSEDKVDLFGSSATCTNNSFSGTLAGPSSTLTVKTVNSNCTAFGLPATVAMTGCDYLFHNEAGATNVTVSLLCPEGVKGVDITAYSSSTHGTALCHVTVTPFTTPKPGLRAHTVGNHVNIAGTVEGIDAHQNRTNFLCPPGTETKAAKYTVQEKGITIAGNNGAFSVS